MSTPINQVQVLEQLLFLASENVQISPSSDFFTSVSDCLHIFRALTSQKNASAWVRPNYVRRRNDNNHADGDAPMFWILLRCHAEAWTSHEPADPWVQHWKRPGDPHSWSRHPDCFCQRHKNSPEMLFVVIWCLFVVMLCSFVVVFLTLCCNLASLCSCCTSLTNGSGSLCSCFTSLESFCCCFTSLFDGSESLCSCCTSLFDGSESLCSCCTSLCDGSESLCSCCFSPWWFLISL